MEESGKKRKGIIAVAATVFLTVVASTVGLFYRSKKRESAEGAA